MLNAYNGQTAGQRLIVRGISPEVVQPILIADVDQSTPQSRSGMLLSMLPYFLILTVFAGGSYLATDATAGERERQSLEPLLINPVSRGQIMSGKLIATFAFAVASLALSLVAFSLVTPLLPVEKIGMIVKMGPIECALMFLIVAPLGLIGAGLLTSVSGLRQGLPRGADLQHAADHHAGDPVDADGAEPGQTGRLDVQRAAAQPPVADRADRARRVAGGLAGGFVDPRPP